MKKVFPGLLLALGVMLLAKLLSGLLPAVGTALLALMLGMLLRQFIARFQLWQAGVVWTFFRHGQPRPNASDAVPSGLPTLYNLMAIQHEGRSPPIHPFHHPLPGRGFGRVMMPHV